MLNYSTKHTQLKFAKVFAYYRHIFNMKLCYFEY